MRAQLIVTVAIGAWSVAGVAHGGSVVFSSAGADAAANQAAVNAFRSGLGGVNNGAGGGPFATGRREINWDGVPDGVASPSLFPANFFNPASPPPGSQRGALFSTPGSGFLVSQRVEAGGAANVRFGDIDPAYASIFQTFSAQRLFAAKESTITDVTFFVPSSPGTPATVLGFGAVFTDVDLADSTKLEFFDANDQLLTSQNVPALAGGLSFLGVLFDAGESVGRVRITSGNTAMGPGVVDGARGDFFQDIVAMDDFIYGEPVPGPGVGAAALVILGMAARRRR